jgi:hypothetical protein
MEQTTGSEGLDHYGTTVTTTGKWFAAAPGTAAREQFEWRTRSVTPAVPVTCTEVARKVRHRHEAAPFGISAGHPG